MTQCTADFETGVNGATIATGDTGSATAWSAVTLHTSSTAIYDTTHVKQGSLAAKLVSTGNECILQWSSGAVGTVSDHYGRLYMYVTGAPTTYINIFNAYTTGTLCGLIRYSSTGKLLLLNTSASTVGTSTNSVATGQWVRIEWYFHHNASTGTLEVKLFNTVDSATPTETLTSAATNTQASANTFFFGTGFDLGTGSTWWLDAVIAGAASYPGPISTGGIIEPGFRFGFQ